MLSLMYFLAHRSQLKLNSAFSKISLDTPVYCSQSFTLVGLSWAKTTQGKNPNYNCAASLVGLNVIAIIAEGIFKEI